MQFLAGRLASAQRKLELEPEELSSRKSSRELPKLLNELATTRAQYLADPSEFEQPKDVVLASNMISVGVDVPRLGLMVVNGQPKSTAEYIQASSRVGRLMPGFVVTLYNFGRPRGPLALRALSLLPRRALPQRRGHERHAVGTARSRQGPPCSGRFAGPASGARPRWRRGRQPIRSGGSRTGAYPRCDPGTRLSGVRRHRVRRHRRGAGLHRRQMGAQEPGGARKFDSLEVLAEEGSLWQGSALSDAFGGGGCRRKFPGLANTQHHAGGRAFHSIRAEEDPAQVGELIVATSGKPYRPGAGGKKTTPAIAGVEPLGKVRRSQLIATYGIGSIVDLEKGSFMPMGLEDWEFATRLPATHHR